MVAAAPEWFGSAARNIAYQPLLQVFFLLTYLVWHIFAWPVIGSIVFVTGTIFAIVVSFVAIRTIRHAADFPNVETPAGALIGKRMAVVSAVSYGTLWIVVAILAFTGLWRWILPAVALIIGLHFLPLAYVFQRRIDFLFAPITVLFAVVGFVLAAQPDIRWSVVFAVSGMGGAIATAGYAIYLLASYRSVCREAGLAHP